MLTENREHYPCRALYPTEIAYAIKAKEQNNDDKNVLKHHIISFLHQTFYYPNAEIKYNQIDKICKCDQTASNVNGIHIFLFLFFYFIIEIVFNAHFYILINSLTDSNKKMSV